MDQRCRRGVSMTLFEILPSLRQANPRIDRAIWPLSAHVDELGRLCVGEMPLTEVATQFGTPTYVIDEADGRSINTSRQQVSRSTQRSANRSGWSPASPTPKPLATGRSRVTPPSCLVGRPRPDGSPTELKGPAGYRRCWRSWDLGWSPPMPATTPEGFSPMPAPASPWSVCCRSSSSSKPSSASGDGMGTPQTSPGTKSARSAVVIGRRYAFLDWASRPRPGGIMTPRHARGYPATRGDECTPR